MQGMIRFWCGMLLTGLLLYAATHPTVVLAETGADVITLNSGEAITGRITSENDTKIVIETANASQTIFNTQTFSKSQIMSVQREPPEVKTERIAYETIQRFRLNPDQELTAKECIAGIAFCQKYLETYPSGNHNTAVRLQNDRLREEKEQIENGLVKFGDQWMSTSQKAAEQDLRVSSIKLQILRGLGQFGKQTRPNRRRCLERQTVGIQGISRVQWHF